MKIVFLSNYFTHHQKSLSDALAELTDYTFVETVPMTEERKSLGWGMEEIPAYVCSYDRQRHLVEAALRSADAVIAGSAPEELVRGCIQRGQLVLRYSERPLKKGGEWMKYLPRLIKWHLQNPAGKPIYLLCASAYTAGDYASFGLFRNRAFRWGYFPETKFYEDTDCLMAQKPEGSLLWAGRFLDWKHPDDALRVAARLKAEGIPFTLKLIGQGPMVDTLKQMIREENLADCVHLLDPMKPEQVRQHMERSRIFLFTSDRQEGWGAVLNEAMNSGCAPVACREAGSVPYLIQDGENGRVYAAADPQQLYRLVKELLENPAAGETLGRRACETITEQWNGKTAARHLVQLIGKILAGKDAGNLYAEGPCSPAPRKTEP